MRFNQLLIQLIDTSEFRTKCCNINISILKGLSSVYHLDKYFICKTSELSFHKNNLFENRNLSLNELAVKARNIYCLEPI